MTDRSTPMPILNSHHVTHSPCYPVKHYQPQATSYQPSSPGLARSPATSHRPLSIVYRPKMSYYDDVYAIVKQIPYGRISTYGRIAAMTAVPRGARGVGWALAGLSDS